MSHRIIIADVLDGLRQLDDESVQCIVTSPPYWNLRNYGTATWEGGDADCEHESDGRYYTEKTAAGSSSGAFSEAGEANAKRLKEGRWRERGKCVKCGAAYTDRQIGLEPTISEYVEKMRDVFRECKRVLRNDGTLWLNLGDSYIGYKGDNYCANPSASNLQKKSKVPASHTNGTPQTSGLREKNLCGIPWRVAFALQDDGYYLRKDIIWAKPNPMPESVRDRPTSAHEYIFLLTKSAKYFYDADAIREPLAESSIARLSQDVANQAGSDRANGGTKSNGTMKAVSTVKYGEERKDESRPSGKFGRYPGWRNDPEATPSVGANARSVWTIATEPYSGSHYAVFPSELPRRCILAGSKAGDTVLDPFAGSGTTIQVAIELGRNVIGIDLDERNRKLIEQRILGSQPPLLI